MSRLLTSQRDFETNKVWNYFRSLAKSKAHLLFGEMTTGMYELDVLSGLLSTAMSNSDDLTDSVRARDIFAKHPLIEVMQKLVANYPDFGPLKGEPKFVMFLAAFDFFFLLAWDRICKVRASIPTAHHRENSKELT